MKYIKTYENLNNPKVGDYVIIDSSKFEDDIKYFFDNEIGTLVEINDTELKYDGYPYEVKFNKIIPSSSLGPGDLDIIAFKKKEMIAWSNNLEDLKIIINSKKYNI